MRLPLILSVATVMSGCATVELSERAAKVQVHNQMSTLVANCKSLGPVTGEGLGPIAAPADGVPQAKANARDKTADMGGDTLVILNTDIYAGSFLPHRYGRAVVQGNAMKCH